MRPMQRRYERFLAHPSSIRYAVGLISGFTVMAVLVGAVIIRVFDHSEYETFGEALWFMLQTVTTVGYGDLTPEKPVGRIVASVVMLTSIGVITVVTAAVTSTFLAAARQRSEQTADLTREEARRGYEELAQRLDRIEQILGRLSQSPPSERTE